MVYSNKGICLSCKPIVLDDYDVSCSNKLSSGH